MLTYSQSWPMYMFNGYIFVIMFYSNFTYFIDMKCSFFPSQFFFTLSLLSIQVKKY